MLLLVLKVHKAIRDHKAQTQMPAHHFGDMRTVPSWMGVRYLCRVARRLALTLGMCGFKSNGNTDKEWFGMEYDKEHIVL